MRRPLLGRFLLLAALALPAAAWCAAPMRGGGKSGGLFGKVSPPLAEAIFHTLASKGFDLPGFKSFPPEHPALRPLASVLQDPEGFLKLDEPARQAALLQALPLARTAVQRKAADLVALAAKEDRASLSEAVDGLGAIEDDYPMFLEDRQLKLVAAVREPAAEKLAALTLDKAKKTADALGGDKRAEPPAGQDAAVKDGRRDQARLLLARIRGGLGETGEYAESLAALAALAKKGPDEGLERLILNGLVAYLRDAEDGRKVLGKHDYLALRAAILDVAASSFFENTQLLAIRGLEADLRVSWRPNGAFTLKKVGELALASRSRRVKEEARRVLESALEQDLPGPTAPELPMILGTLGLQSISADLTVPGPWEARPSASVLLPGSLIEDFFGRVRIAPWLSLSKAGLLLAFFAALSLAGLVLRNAVLGWGFLGAFLLCAAAAGLLLFADLRARRLLIAHIGELLARPESQQEASRRPRPELYWKAKLRGPKGLRSLKDLSKAELETLEEELKEQEARPPLILDN